MSPEDRRSIEETLACGGKCQVLKMNGALCIKWVNSKNPKKRDINEAPLACTNIRVLGSHDLGFLGSKIGDGSFVLTYQVERLCGRVVEGI